MTHDVTPQEEIAHVEPERGRGAAFFDLDRTLMAGSSGLYWARAARGAGLLTRRRIARYGWENVKFRLRGSTDQATDRVRREVGEMISGQRVVDLQRLAPKVLAGVLPRLYPQMLEVAHAHQDAGRPVYICTAASQEMAEMLAHVLSFDGALGARSEVVDGHYTGRSAGPFTYREGKAVAMRELAAAADLDLAASYAYSDSESDLPMLRVVGHPVAVNPDAELRRVAREEGWEIMRFEQLGRRLKAAGAVVLAALVGTGARTVAGAQAMSLHELSDEQREIRDLARRFADDEIAPQAGAWDREHTFPREVFKHLGELGLMGVCVPEEHGGSGADFLSYVLVLEELSRADAGVGVTVAVHTSAGTLPLLTHGTPEQVGRMVPPLAQGHELAAFALTESGSGSDAGAMRTRAESSRLTGTKQWITNGSHAHNFLVFARDPERASAFVVRRGAQGFAVTREEEKLGLNSSSTADLSFEDTPAELLGVKGAGMRIALQTLDAGRIGIAAQAVGIAQAALDVAAAYAQERHAFGRPIGGFGAIQQKLADMQTEIEAARALVWRAARLKEAGRPHSVEGAQAKLFASRVARHWTGEAIQVLGGYGYTKEFPVERYYRDAKVTEIYEGTSEIQRLVIARALLGEAARES